MNTVAVVLSGCGVFDGSEITETVLTLLHLERNGMAYQCVAPDIPQSEVINHVTQMAVPQNRNVLEEAARIARGVILPLSAIEPNDYVGAIFPGGFGVAKQLSNFASKGPKCEIDKGTQAFIQKLFDAKKPMGFMCIAPILAARLLPEGVTVTIGCDPNTVEAIEAMGAKHIVAKVNEVVIDSGHKIVSTPAYMLAHTISEVDEGINKFIKAFSNLLDP